MWFLKSAKRRSEVSGDNFLTQEAGMIFPHDVDVTDGKALTRFVAIDKQE